MDLLRDVEKKVLQDYQQRLNLLNERPETMSNNNSQVHTKYRYSSLLDNNNGKPTYYQEQYQQEYEHLQKENRSNSVKLTNANPLLASNNQEQYQQNSGRKKPLNGLTPNEYVNSKIQKQIELRNDFVSKDNSLHNSFDRPNPKEKQQYIKQGRFQVPSVNLFAQNFEGSLPKNVDLVNKSSNDLYAQEQNDYDVHLQSLQISQKLNTLIQRGMIADKKREEKVQLFENILQTNSQLDQQEILNLLEQVEENNQNKTLYNQTNFNDREHSIVHGLQNAQDHDQHKQNTHQNIDQSELDYQPVKISTKSTLKEKDTVKSSTKLKSADSKSKLNSKKDNEKSKTKKNKKGTLSTIKESDISSQQTQKDAKKKSQSIATLSSMKVKDVAPISTKNSNTLSQKFTTTQNNKSQPTITKLDNQSLVLNDQQNKNPIIAEEKTQQQIIQESEGFTAVMKSEQASHNNQAMEFLKQQMIQNQAFRDNALAFVKQYISSK